MLFQQVFIWHFYNNKKKKLLSTITIQAWKLLWSFQHTKASLKVKSIDTISQLLNRQISCLHHIIRRKIISDYGSLNEITVKITKYKVPCHKACYHCFHEFTMTEFQSNRASFWPKWNFAFRAWISSLQI